jgi:hypothetical protein
MMAARTTATFEFLFGRSRIISLQIGIMGVFLSIAVSLIGRMVPLGAIVVYRSDIATIIASTLFLGGAATIAYFNSGYIVVLVIQILLLFGLFTSGGIAVYTRVSLLEEIQLMVRFAIIIAIMFSTIGYAAGTTVRNILNN